MFSALLFAVHGGEQDRELHQYQVLYCHWFQLLSKERGCCRLSEGMRLVQKQVGLYYAGEFSGRCGAARHALLLLCRPYTGQWSTKPPSGCRGRNSIAERAVQQESGSFLLPWKCCLF